MTKIKIARAGGARSLAVRVATIAALALVAGACSSGSGSAAEPATFATTSTARASAAYAFYVAHNPDPYLVLSRNDAQQRAYFGCGTKWSAGTVDGVLAKAYKGICPSTPGNLP
jgi:hypothetical protein